MRSDFDAFLYLRHFMEDFTERSSFVRPQQRYRVVEELTRRLTTDTSFRDEFMSYGGHVRISVPVDADGRLIANRLDEMRIEGPVDSRGDTMDKKDKKDGEREPLSWQIMDAHVDSLVNSTKAMRLDLDMSETTRMIDRLKFVNGTERIADAAKDAREALSKLRYELAEESERLHERSEGLKRQMLDLMDRVEEGEK